MRLEVNGTEYKDFLTLNVELRLDALSNIFTFEAAAPGVSRLPFKKGDPVRVIVDGEPVLSGFVEIIGGGYDTQSHGITIQGRDKTGDIVDSTLDNLGDIRSPISLKALIEKTIKSTGSTLKVIDNANPKQFNEALDVAAPESEKNVAEFILEKAHLRQVLLTSNSDGNIVIEKTPGGDSNGFLQNITNAANNNILSADFSYDDTGRFNVYKFVSSLNPIALNKTNNTQISSIVSQKGSVIDTGIRVGRQLILIPDSATSDDSNSDLAKWEANIRKARGNAYSCVVQGYRPEPGFDIWLPNRLVHIVDEFAGINAQMLINTVNFSMSRTTGRLTTLTLIEKNAYTLTLNEPKSQDLGAGFA